LRDVFVLGGHPKPTPVDLLDLTVREIAFQGSVSHCFADFVRAEIKKWDEVGKAANIQPTE
jgi:hypothetical protein